MQVGKLVRLRQFMSEAQRSFIIAVDQIIPRGLHPALQSPIEALETISRLPCDALLLHSGLVKLAATALAGRKPFLIKLTTATTEAADKTNRIQVDTVEHALKLGAVGVAMNVFIGSSYEPMLLSQFGITAELCDDLGMPLIAMINPLESMQFDAHKLAYVCRVGAELGADAIKTDYPGSPDAFRIVIENTPLPVLIEESPLPETIEGTFESTRGAMSAGGAGVMFGPRVWAQPDPQQVAEQIVRMIHG